MFPIILLLATGTFVIKLITPAKASLPYIKEAGPFKTSARAKLISSTSTPCSSPHCCPSCLTPSFKIKTRLYPNPLIKGLEIAGPEDNCATPGTRVNASIIFVFADCNNIDFLTKYTGAGVFLIMVAPATPVTVTP